MSTSYSALVDEYIERRQGLGYKLKTQSGLLRGFGRYLDQLEHRGPIPASLTLQWAAASTTEDPCNPARRLSVVRGFLRALAARDATTEVPPVGILGPTERRKPPHVYTDGEIAALLKAAAELSPPGGLRPDTYCTLFSLLLCTGLRISEALALSRTDVDLTAGIITVRAGKGGKTRLVPLHSTALDPLRRYAARRAKWRDEGPSGGAFFRTESSVRLGYATVYATFDRMRRRLGWTAEGRARTPRIHDTRHRFVVSRLLLWLEQGIDIDSKMAALATHLGHVLVTGVYWYLTAVPELTASVARRFERFAQSQGEGGVS